MRRRAAEAEQRGLEQSLLADVSAAFLEGGDVQSRLRPASARLADALHVGRARIELDSLRRPERGEASLRLVAGDRPVGTLFFDTGASLDAEAAQRLLPALASLLAVAADRERLARAAVEAETLRRSDVMKTTLLRAVSHDLRSPLTAIRAAAEGLSHETLELGAADRDELLATIRVEAARLERLVSNLLDISRLEAGGAKPRPELWSVDGLVAVALEAVPGSEHVEVELDESGPPVRVDPAHIERVLANVLENALAATSDGGAVVIRVDSEGDEVRIRVDDEGPGLPSNDARADLRAVRARRPGSRDGARPRDRARFRRGERRPPVGRGVAARRRGVRAGAACRRGRAGAVVSAQRVLVVDDEVQILRALRTNLRGAGYEVDTAETAEQALAAAAMRPPDAVILDLVLPDGSGTDVCRRLREWTKVPIVVLSAVGDEQEKIAALDAGADDYVTKPFGIDELLARLRAVLRRASPAAGPVLDIGELRIDLDKRAVSVAGNAALADAERVRPPARLAQNEGKLLTHRALLREVWGPRTTRSRTTSTSTCRNSAARSSPIRRGRATSSPSRARATGSSRRPELFLRRRAATLRPA